MRQPADPAFNDLVRSIHGDPGISERMVFVDNDNEIRWVVYPREFKADVLGAVRDHLLEQGVLKAVIHVGAIGVGQRGPRKSFVEYLPDEHLYTVETHPPELVWLEAEDEEDPGSLYNNGAGEEE